MTRRFGGGIVDLWWCCVAAVMTLGPDSPGSRIYILATDRFSHIPLLWLLKNKSPRQSFFWGWLCEPDQRRRLLLTAPC